MNIDTNGASKRPRLSLAFAGGQRPTHSPSERGAHILPVHELRRIVAAMVG